MSLRLPSSLVKEQDDSCDVTIRVTDKRYPFPPYSSGILHQNPAYENSSSELSPSSVSSSSSTSSSSSSSFTAASDVDSSSWSGAFDKRSAVQTDASDFRELSLKSTVLDSVLPEISRSAGEESGRENEYGSENGQNGLRSDGFDQSDLDNLPWRYWIALSQRENHRKSESFSGDLERFTSKVPLQQSLRRASSSAPEELRELCSVERIHAARERVRNAALKLLEAQQGQQEVQRRQSGDRGREGEEEGKREKESQSQWFKESRAGKGLKEREKNIEGLRRWKPKGNWLLTWLTGKRRTDKVKV